MGQEIQSGNVQAPRWLILVGLLFGQKKAHGCPFEGVQTGQGGLGRTHWLGGGPTGTIGCWPLYLLVGNPARFWTLAVTKEPLLMSCARLPVTRDSAMCIRKKQNLQLFSPCISDHTVWGLCWYNVVLRHVMLCYVMLCYVMLCYVMLCYVMLCYVMLCYVMLCYVMLCYVMLCYVMLCYVMLCYVMLCYVMLCYVMLCYVMLCYVMLCYVM